MNDVFFSPGIDVSSSRKTPLRIGIWCAYHITLEPSEGIGVFVHNLARGLAQIPQCESVTMMIRPDDEHVVAKTVELGQGRIRTASAKALSKWQLKTKKLAWKVFFLGYQIEQRVCKRIDKSIATIGNSNHGAITRTGAHVSKTAWSLGLGVLRSMMRKTHRIFDGLEKRDQTLKEDIIQSCDVWIIPYVGLPQSFSKPTVVAIHDLVCYHFPDMLSPNELQRFKDLAEKVAAESTVAACMSQFICDTDLYGVLGLSPRKVRVVQPASPSDFGQLGDIESALTKYPMLKNKYIFYPSAFRGYKNHEQLVDALAELQRQGDTSLHVVFTGIHSIPRKLQEHICNSGVAERIHVLGKVDRDVLSVVYKQAWATMVPSLYEQGSFPLMEAMYWGCPIASSNIASLKELFQSLGDRMKFFDPYDVQDLIRVIREFESHREQILARQQEARNAVFGRTWTMAAVDWAGVCYDAIELANSPIPQGQGADSPSTATPQSMRAA